MKGFKKYISINNIMEREKIILIKGSFHRIEISFFLKKKIKKIIFKYSNHRTSISKFIFRIMRKFNK
jgi:hypothetical protein